MQVKTLVRSAVPEGLLSAYHYILAIAAAARYGFPSRRIVVIGVTGTKGKTSTANFIWSCLSAGGIKTGIITTANIRIGEREVLNAYHMTMPGPFTIQRLLREMVRAGCTHCVIETTSEGLKQHRNVGIRYDIGVFTNLFPEHLPSHGGSFDTYKKVKGEMFAVLRAHARKTIDRRQVEKIIIANVESEHAPYFLAFPADHKVTFAVGKKADYTAEEVRSDNSGVAFKVGGAEFRLSIPGTFNVSNALPAVVISKLAHIDNAVIARGLSSLSVIPGRMERIDEGQDFTVFVDYAHEGESMHNVLETATSMRAQGGKIIVLLGAEGGGRDKAKRPVMGKLTGAMADYVVVSNVDPYEDDPREIVEDIAQAAENAGKTRDKNLFVIEDRRAGIQKALSLASAGDIVLITGKGAEQSMVLGGKSIPWDDRVVVREGLKKLL
ncbi:UDP-N-acetylmuramoyl-L-alanyl-D-glutamate--2,6-diaminopimelate ligase [Candidatus Kaiserbacteria bacterium]|nr:UDP-N-acetylmuramoyl-L-alanyl-D-glutamate--2,6-diaminopimelate ligase [Candidatus Kaiserbacteria bacterium]